jgi:hypothetical protein
MSTRHVLRALVFATAVAVATPAAAQQGTVVTTGGERVSGLVRDMDRNGFTVNVGGNERRIMAPEIAFVDFGGGRDLKADEVARLRQGRQVVILKNGTTLVGEVASYERTMQGELADLPKEHAFRVHFNVEGSAARTFLSSEVARLYFTEPSAAQGTAGRGAAPLATAPNQVIVDGTRPWTATGITVARNQTVQFASSGTIQLGLGADDVAGPSGSRTGRLAPGAPLPKIPAGALIGRVGNGPPFAIGGQPQVLMPANGELFLGVNDDGFGDNSGQFTVTVTAGGRAVKR